MKVDGEVAHEQKKDLLKSGANPYYFQQNWVFCLKDIALSELCEFIKLRYWTTNLYRNVNLWWP